MSRNHYVVTNTDSKPSEGDTVKRKIVTDYEPDRNGHVWQVEDVDDYIASE